MFITGRILSLDWHKDGQVLVTGGSDATIRVYEVSTGTNWVTTLSIKYFSILFNILCL